MDFGTERRDRPPPVHLSSAEMIRYRDEKRTMAFTLVNGQTIEGRVLWFDDISYHVIPSSGAELTVLKHCVLYYSAQPQ